MATTGEEASAKIAEAGCFASTAGEQAGAKSAKEDPRELTSTGMVSQGVAELYCLLRVTQSQSRLSRVSTERD